MVIRATTSPGLHPTNSLDEEGIFRLLVETISDYAIFVLTPEGFVATWNAGAQRIKGYDRSEIIGKHFSVFYPQKEIDNRKPDHELEIAKASGRFEEEGWRVRKDGTRFWANVVITSLVDSHGKLLGFGKITRDLTERRLADLRYKLLVTSVQDYAIFSLDSEGVVTSWNLGAERIKGYSAEEIVGRHFSQFYTEEDRRAGLPGTVLATAVREDHYQGEGWRVRKDGTRFWSSVVVTPLYDEEGTLTGFSKVTRDMTDRKMLMDQIRRHAEELEHRITQHEETNAELEAFSYSVSHDLRAPLRAVEGFAQALREEYADKLDDVGNDYLDEIQSAAVRMNRLVQDLLSYGRLGRVELAFTSVSLLRAVEGVLAELGADRKYVHVDVDPTLHVLAHDPTLRQVLLNLIGNALKFRRPDADPEVAVTASSSDTGTIHISVADRGIGISPQHHDRIFKVFERLHSGDSYPGTGIGLAIVQRAVTRMRGHVGLESTPDQGSTFWFELPNAEGK
jgi:PAS domain S-box-containing protein